MKVCYLISFMLHFFFYSLLSELTPILETVDMSNNVIKKIPAGLGKISKLKKLKLPGNEIAKVPRTVGKLKDLNECDMSRNKIKSIPPTITKANKLERMILKHNRHTRCWI